MKRILVAVGALAVVLVTAVGAVALVGDTGDPVPAQQTTKTPTPGEALDPSAELDSDAIDRQVEEQKEQQKAAQQELERRVTEEAERLNQGN